MGATPWIRPRPVLEQQLAALHDLDRAGQATAFHHGAFAALGWMIEGGPGPLTGALAACPVPSRAIVAELATAEDLIYSPTSPRRDYARGVEHALMWAQHATAAPPLPRPLAGRSPDVPTPPVRPGRTALIDRVDAEHHPASASPDVAGPRRRRRNPSQ